MKQSTRQRIYQLSRDTYFLARLSGIIVLVSALIAFAITSTAGPETEPTNDAQASVPSAHVARHLRARLQQAYVSPGSGDARVFDSLIDERIEDPGENSLFKAFVRVAVHDREGPEALRTLQERAANRPVERFANEFMGDLHWWQDQDEVALAHYEAESLLPEARYARSQVVALLLKHHDHERLLQIASNPNYNLDDHQSILRLGVLLRDPMLILKGVFLHDYGTIPVFVWPLTLLVGALWFVMVLKICQVESFNSAPVYAGLLGLLLGVLSTTFTLFAVVWQEEIWGFMLDDNQTNNLIVYVCGVGVREEIIKLLFFLPLTPWLYRLRDPKAILVAASSVGLGFAIQENLGYFGNSGSAAFARFVTANFYHIALTGTLGFAFCRFLYTPRSEWDRFLGTFIMVVLAHGLYDFLGSADGVFFAIMVFCFFSYHYFQLIRTHCTTERQAISPLGVFVVGCALVIGLSMMTSAVVTTHFLGALSSVGEQLIAFVPLMFLFINQFRND